MDALLVLSQLFTGAVSGLILVLLALGLSLIFGLMNVVNFAHGTLYMVGAYAAYSAISLTDSFWVGLIAGPLVVGALGFVIERVLIRQVYGRPAEESILLTFGLTFVLVETTKLLFGKVGLPVNLPPALSEAIDLKIVILPSYLLFVGGMALVAITGLWYVLEKTDIGLVVRAGTRDNIMVRVLGINFDRIRVITFVLGISLAGLAGVLSAPIRGVTPEMGQAILSQSFVVVVVGGKDSFWGTVVSGLLIGVLVALTSLWFPQMSDIVMFLLMAVVLLVRPRGLFGTA